MIHKIGNVKDNEKISGISDNEKSVIHKFANILTSMYGSDRDIDNDYGGYILFATKGTTNEEIKAVFDYEANLVEYTELHDDNICAAIYITSTEFGVVLIMHLDDAPDIIRQSIVKQSYKVRINENLSRIIDVEAISMQEALKQVMDKYKNSEIILNSDDFTDVYFNMNSFPSRDTVDKLRKEYPEGTRLVLISMDDPYSKLVSGDRGSVTGIDDAGTLHMRWDSGSHLGLVYGEDSFRKLTLEELEQEKV